MLRCGVPVGQALVAVAREQSDARLAQAWQEVRGRVESGSTLSEAMSRRGDVFPMLLVMMTRAGEETGDIWGRLERAGEWLARQADHQQRVRQALTTPALTAVFSGLVLVALIKLVLPRFTELYSGMKLELPLITRIVTALVNGVNHPSFPGVVLILAAIVVAQREMWRRRLSELCLQLPYTRDLYGALLASQFSELLSSLHASGVSLNRALALLAQASEPESHCQRLTNVRQAVEQGTSLAESVARELPYFPRVIAGMLEVGAHTGRLDQVLHSARQVLDLEVESRLNFVRVSLEPILMAVLGAVLSFFFVATILPLYQLVGKLG